ncbi:MAG: hypothetical protein KAS32_14450 [Candidatus Peribacteraceae bacterium]|nr:hypothetical protein [Candidatus Peribacteraceae bacterium]
MIKIEDLENEAKRVIDNERNAFMCGIDNQVFSESQLHSMIAHSLKEQQFVLKLLEEQDKVI